MVIPDTVVVGEPVEFIVGVTGPEMNVHESEPTEAALAAIVVDPGLVQIV